MNPTIFYAILATLIISLTSLIGVFTLRIKNEKLQKLLIYFVAFSAGALLGDVFFHLLPEYVEEYVKDEKNMQFFGILTISGIIISLFIEKIIHRNHCHHTITSHHHHSFAIMNLVGDFVHNFSDGLIIGASFLVSIPAGIATSIAVLLHEIPQEIGDFAILIHGGFEKKKAIFMNFLVSLTAILGTVSVFILGNSIENIEYYLVPIATGMFIYIAGTDLIPEMHKHNEKISSSLIQILMFILGVGILYSLLIFE